MSKNVRATLVTVTVGKEITSYTVANKELGQKLLFTLAVRHWGTRMGSTEMPGNRKQIVERFFGPNTGNGYVFSSTTIMSGDSLATQQASADKIVERQNKARQKAYEAKQASEPVGRTRS